MLEKHTIISVPSVVGVPATDHVPDNLSCYWDVAYTSFKVSVMIVQITKLERSVIL
jgi:hypothetical protein